MSLSEERVLEEIFPGQAVILASGKTIVVKPWGMRALVQEVPEVLASIAKRVFDSISLGRTGSEEMISTLLKSAGRELMELVRWTVKLSEEEFDQLSAADGLRLMRAIMKQNEAFFVELAGLVGDLTAELAGDNGSTSPQPSKEQATA